MIDEFNDMEQAAIEDGAPTKAQVRHTHWWSDEMGFCCNKLHPILEHVRDDPDMKLSKHGTSVDSDGVHEMTLTFEVRGEAWGGDETDEERDSE